ncbi:type IX secretion system membrane protein PorP/SprF [Pedobacter aquatilis]|uniref:PorP/SprF family type IX secretion system membrane protein n=1 Tax=Pedobacter aquatilis TaxID=351343 RepID=UPI00292CF728|nr:type IX secretion system membrane protein PorP/SprF [Pedobacter aquatilis]
MMRKILLLSVSLLLMVKIAAAQQDAQYSQYMFNGIYINPAYAGYKEVLNVHSFYRTQWTGIQGAPRSMALAVDAIANDGNVGLALQVASDKLGAQTNLSVYGNYAYRIRMNDDGSSRLALGVGAGMVNLSIDGSMLNPNRPEVGQPIGTESTIVPDARAGVYFSNDKFYAGLSADNLISQYIDIDRYAFIPQPKPHYYLTAGALLPINQDFQVKPSLLIKDDRGGPTSLDVNAFLMIKDLIWLGGSYRTGIKLYDKSYLQRDLSPLNSATAAIQIFPSQKLRIGYAYDFSVGPLQGYSGGTHEISIAFSFIKPNVRMSTPRFF